MRRTRFLLKNPVFKPINKNVPSEILSQNFKLVGKNSQFLTNLRSEFLDETSVKNKHKPSEFEMKYNAARVSLMNELTLNSENTDKNNQISYLLKSITPTYLKDADFQADLKSYEELTRYITVVDQDIPPIPPILTVTTFKQYIRQLTTYEYTHKKASNLSTGIIAPLLKSLFQPENQNIRFVRDIDSYNYLIIYFLKTKDLAYARVLLKQLETDFVVPNTLTYNAFLYHLTRPRNAFSVDPLVTTIQLLTQMQQRKIKANLTTWYLVLKIIRDDSIFFKELQNLYRDEFSLPNNPQFQMISLEVSYESMDTQKLVALVEKMILQDNIKSAASAASISLVLQKYLNESRIDDAWLYLQEVVRKGFQPNTAILQLFLEKFQDMELFHLSVGAFYSFIDYYGIKPSRSNFYSLILATTKTGFHKNWRKTARIVYHEMRRLQNGSSHNKAGYWIERLKLRALTERKRQGLKLDLASPLSKEEVQLCEEMRTHFLWKDHLVIQPSKCSDKKFKRLCEKIGWRPTKKDNSPNSAPSQKEALLRKEYKNKIKLKNMAQNYFHRSKIATKGQLNHLVDELKARDILSASQDLHDLGINNNRNDTKINTKDLFPKI